MPLASPPPATTPPDDQNTLLRALIPLAAAGDVKAFEQVYQLTARGLLARVRGIVGESLAEDVLSDVYLQVWSSLATFDCERGQPVAWMLTIARTRALDRVRAEVRLHGGSVFVHPAHPAMDASHCDGPEQLLDAHQSHQSVRDCLARLNAEERAVLVLAYFRDCSVSEIAAHLSMPLGTVKSLIRRAQIKLRKALAAQVAGTALPSGSPSVGAASLQALP